MKIDVVSGVLTIAIGIVVAIMSSQYRIGTLSSMGTGYFPLALSLLLIGLGTALLISGLKEKVSQLSLPSAGSALLILATPIVFGLLIERVGLVPSLAGVGLLGAFAPREGSYLEKIITAVGVTAVAVLIFKGGIGMPIPLFKWELQ
jgi:putative tricarboxylic transport membrane protein